MGNKGCSCATLHNSTFEAIGDNTIFIPVQSHKITINITTHAEHR